MIYELNEARRLFSTGFNCPTCVVVYDGSLIAIQDTLAAFELNTWAVTAYNCAPPQESGSLTKLTPLIQQVDLVYVVVAEPNHRLLDIGYLIGTAKYFHRPVFVDFRVDPVLADYPTVLQLADGVGMGYSDMLLFLDTHSRFTELSDEVTRIRAVASKIKRLRLI